MKAYLKELPGRVHNYKEDSACSSFLTDAEGKNWGLFMVADGLSGYNGDTASNLAVKVIQYSITDALQQPDVKDYSESIRNSIIKAHKSLKERRDTFTTLSLALVSEDDLYVAHLGDGFVRMVYEDAVFTITPTENRGGIPSNYLGEAYLLDKSIEERINLLQPYREGKKKPLGLQLETDGLTSRLSEKEIKELLLKIREYDEPSAILELYEQSVRIPRRGMLELPKGKLKMFLKDGAPSFSYPPELNREDCYEELVDTVLSAYLLRNNQELNDMFDHHLLKYDDTTVIYVDLQEITRGKMAKSQQTISDLRTEEARLQQDLGRISLEKESLEKRVQELTDSKREVEKTLQEVTAERDNYQRKDNCALYVAREVLSKQVESNPPLGQVLKDKDSSGSKILLMLSKITDLFRDDSDHYKKTKKSDEGKNKS